MAPKAALNTLSEIGGMAWRWTKSAKAALNEQLSSEAMSVTTNLFGLFKGTYFRLLVCACGFRGELFLFGPKYV